MNNLSLKSLMLAGTCLSFSGVAFAQEAGFSWEGSVEIGVEANISSDDATAEFSDTYGIVELGGEYGFGNGLSVFTLLAAESLTDAVDDRAFEDMGVYVQELGLRYAIGSTEFTIGKFAPVFGRSWDETAGFFGTTLAEDYELTEQLGFGADVAIGDTGGTLSAAVFFADDTGLSRSIGFDRGRNTTAAGGAGNTGELDNASLTWTQEWGNTTAQFGARYLSAGVGDVDDETGFVASVGHAFDNGLALFGEVALFDNFGGGADDATYLTLNAVYGIGDNWSVSGTVARRDLDTAGTTDLISVGAEYALDNGITFGAALAQVEEAGVDNTILGANVVFPLGG